MLVIREPRLCALIKVVVICFILQIANAVCVGLRAGRHDSGAVFKAG